MSGGYSATGLSYRKGKTVYTPGKKDNTCTTIFLGILFVLVMVGSPIYLGYAEYNFVLVVASISEVANDVVEVDAADQVPFHGKQIVHTTGMINRDAEVVDESFHVRVSPALVLNRNTEYCQWMEHQREECQTCTKTEGNKKTSYKCNCVTMYSYTKGWTPFRINSLLFQQPAAHYNPQRDPYPSASFVSQNTHVNGFDLDPSLVSNLKATPFYVDWNDNAERQDKWYDSLYLPVRNYFGGQQTHYRHLYELDYVRSSRAAQEEAFFYIGEGGYFFSPYSASNQEKVLKWMVQAFEGSLLDWQVGDFFGCTPGDLRVSYTTKLPPKVSAIGKAHISEKASQLGLISTQQGRKQLGLLHEGDVAPEQMFQRELDDEKSFLRIARALFLVWGAVVGDAILVYFGVSRTPWAVGCAVLGSWGVVLSFLQYLACASVDFSTIWCTLWGACFLALLVVSVSCFPRSHEDRGFGAILERYKSIFLGETTTTIHPKKE